MLVDQAKFEEILKTNKLIVTKSRTSLYQSLAGHNRPVDINTLITALSEQVDRSSVYRNIETFTKIGVVNKVYTGWKYRLELSEKFRPHHHHLTCSNCGKIVQLDLGHQVESDLKKLGRNHSFQITGHEVELYGLCKNCRISQPS